ncbi:PREDICTED: nuclear GTPase SLIP-GC [Condylura cristata]|uniref:nuclear GTPase SLIP-GC n=1 Tax=Condylura cristata TaxID=143302 RepID=UPI0003345FC2|nr:PREDICTED: nuclear GTPase SLIP-GC [Condylura cristata]
MAEPEDSVGQEPWPDDSDVPTKEPMKKRRRSDRDQRFRAFPSAEQSALKEYERLESRTRRVLSSTYQKLLQAVFLDDSIPSSVKYLINRLLALIEQPSWDPVYIGLLGSSGAGKSSLINALIQQEVFLPVSGESTRPSCIVQVSASRREQYEAKIHLLSDQEWKEELKNLTKFLHRPEELGGEEEAAWGRDEAADALWKLRALYGRGAERRGFEELLRAKPKGKIPTSRTITLKADEAAELSLKLDPYIRTPRRGWEGQATETQIWPLIKYVEVTLPKSELIPEGVVLVDIPGAGDFNSKRDEMWKKTIDKCSVIWVVSDTESVSGGRAHEALLHEGIKACQRGFCSDVALVVTKTDELPLPEYLREREAGPQADQRAREAVLERNEMIKLQRSRILKEKLKATLPAAAEVLDASPLVYTVSAQEYWQRALLSEEETEVPRLRESIRKRLLDKKRRRVTTYVTEAFGLLLLTDSFSSMDTRPSEPLHLSGLRRFVEEEIQRLERAVDQCFARLQQPLQEGVRRARASYRRTLGACLVVSGPGRGKALWDPKLFTTLLLSKDTESYSGDGEQGSRPGKQLEGISHPGMRSWRAELSWKAGKPTGLALMPHIDAFKHSLQEKMTEIGLRNGWTSDHRKKSFLAQEVRSSRRAEGEAAQITGRKACERMKDVLRRGVARQVAEGMFERAQERMQHQFLQLKNGITERVKGSIATMLTLASSQGDGLYKELADFKSEFKEMDKLHRSLREVAENAALRRAMQDFLVRMSPRKAAPKQTENEEQGTPWSGGFRFHFPDTAGCRQPDNGEPHPKDAWHRQTSSFYESIWICPAVGTSSRGLLGSLSGGSSRLSGHHGECRELRDGPRQAHRPRAPVSRGPGTHPLGMLAVPAVGAWGLPATAMRA